MKTTLLFILALSTCFGDGILLGKPSSSFKKEETAASNFSYLTDLCWHCFFPIHITGRNVTSSQKDFVSYKPHGFFSPHWYSPLCICKKDKIVGIPAAFWEPQAIIEVTRTPYKFYTFFHAGKDPKGSEKMGSISNSDAGRSSYYNVHYYFYPLARLAMFLPTATCLRNAQVSIPLFMTEWFPFWNDTDSRWHWVVDPVRFIYQHPEMQERCKKDCEASNNRKPTDRYPWCAGCLGSLYPFTGHVPHHIGGIQASSLLVCRTLAMLHTFGIVPGLKLLGVGMGFEPENYCKKTYSYNLKKTIYKTQLLFPVPDKGKEKEGARVYCHPLGESDRDWGSGHTYAKEGEDFSYVVWTKMHCCIDLLDPFKQPIQKLLDGLKSQGDENPEAHDSVKKATKVLDEAMEKAGEKLKDKFDTPLRTDP